MLKGRPNACGQALRIGRAGRLPEDLARGGNLMFEGLFQPMHMLIVAGIALLVFGPKKLPELGKGLGDSIRGFKAAMASEDAVGRKEE